MEGGPAAAIEAVIFDYGGVISTPPFAGVADFEQVAGIGTALARNIYDHLHPGA